MTRVILATAVTANWLPQAMPYLASMERYADGIEPWLVTVNARVNGLDHAGLWRIKTGSLTGEQIAGQPGNGCVQHGAFLPAIPGEDDDVIVFTDADIVLQRWPTAEEVAALRGWEDGEVGVSWNAGADDTLLTEAARLFPRVSVERIREVVKSDDTPVYNVGVTVARRSTWQRLYKLFMDRYAATYELFGHVARQQWTISLLLNTEGFKVRLLPYSFHLHGCYPLPGGAGMRGDGVLTYCGEVVLFRHHI